MSQPPAQPKVYHIVHVDRLASIITDGCLHSDAQMVQRPGTGTTIGMSRIKQRRLTELSLTSMPGLLVGGCVPFYFCPRSVMLFLLHRGNHPDLSYTGGQGPLIHLELDLHAVVEWAAQRGLRWAFTLSNAGAYGFEDRSTLKELTDVDWAAVQATDWRNPDVKHGKQAEFLVEREVSWDLVERVGVVSQGMGQLASNAMANATHRPPVEIKTEWYY